MIHARTQLVLLALDNAGAFSSADRADLYETASEILSGHDADLSLSAAHVAKALREAETCQLLFNQLTLRA